MFSIPHLVWLAICAAAIACTMRWLHARRLPLERVLDGACLVAAVSEVVKLLTYAQIIPTADGSALHVFVEWRHLPFHLCSIQIFLIFYVRFAESARRRETILAFMYPTCIAGAAAALLLPSIFSNGITPAQAFTHPIAYQFFLYHSMLVVLGIYIARCGEVRIRFAHLRSTLGILFGFCLASIYLNSAYAAVVYQGTQILSVENTPNFFFTYRTPIGLELHAIWQWYLYLGILVSLVVVVVTLFYLPFRHVDGEGPRERA